MRTYKIKEIFGPTIQGEGSTLGSVVLFLRFAGCNRWSGRPQDKHKSICHFCDTDFFGGDPKTADEIIAELNSKSETCKTVVISGGEPTLQLDLELVSQLEKAGFVLHLETNGSRELGPMLHYFDHISMSPKQSIEETKLERANDIKLLYPWISEDITKEKFEKFQHTQIYIQPLWESDKQKTLEYIYQNQNLKLSPQLHKYLELQ